MKLWTPQRTDLYRLCVVRKLEVVTETSFRQKIAVTSEEDNINKLDTPWPLTHIDTHHHLISLFYAPCKFHDTDT